MVRIRSPRSRRNGPTEALTVHPVAAVTVIGPIIGRFSTAYPEISLDISVEAECRDIVGEQGESIAQDMIALPIGGPFRFSPVVSPDYLAKKPARGAGAKFARFIPILGQAKTIRRNREKGVLGMKGYVPAGDSEMTPAAATARGKAIKGN
jgi:DNA-binding transcriptional LysR family regulator